MIIKDGHVSIVSWCNRGCRSFFAEKTETKKDRKPPRKIHPLKNCGTLIWKVLNVLN